MTAPGAIDACVFHEWPSTDVLAPYLPDGWREIVTEPGVIVTGSPIYKNLLGGPPPVGDRDSLAQFLADGRRERVVLSYGTGLLVTANPNHFVAVAVAAAANRWTEDQWLAQDERLHGLIMAACSRPEQAAAEIRRSGQHPRMVGVLLGSASLGAPLGHPAYHPIYEAAVEMGLPLVLQPGSDATEHAIASPVAGGLPATGGEYRALAWQTQSSHVSSLVMQGVFDKFPTLRVLLLGAGALWFPGHFWRLDHRFSVTRGDGRWLKGRPIEYADRFYLATYRLDRPPRDETLARALSVVPGLEERFLYASGFADPDWRDMDAALAGVPAEWHGNVLRENARAFFRWPEPEGVPATGAQAAAAG